MTVNFAWSWGEKQLVLIKIEVIMFDTQRITPDNVEANISFSAIQCVYPGMTSDMQIESCKFACSVDLTTNALFSMG